MDSNAIPPKNKKRKQDAIEGGSKKTGKPNKKPVPMSKLERREVNSEPPKYTFEDNLRKVEPFDFVYQTYAKQRWIGMTIYGIFEKEFNDKSPKYYEQSIKNGRITVNGNTVGLDYIVRNSDLIENRIHRHEPPVCDSKIEIVHESDDILVVSKPSSIPVHPTGRYYHNTLTAILKHEFGYTELHPVNRIDRLTSGLVIFARNKTKAAEMMNSLKTRQVQKTYIARVKGKFTHEFIECNEPIETASHKAGVNLVSETGKPCTTLFKFLSYNGITSLVECQPKTGRTHQIRVHLQFLGCPIANDPLYCSSTWDERANLDQKTLVDRVTDTVFAKKDEIDDYDSCFECRIKRRDPIPEQLSIWLHSYRYEAEVWNYQTSLPSWALDNFEGDKILEERFWKFGGLWDGTPPGEHLNDP